jgi:hypothetical protein
LTEAMGAGAALPNGGSLMDKTLAGLQADLVQTSVSVVVDTAIQGGDLSENLVAGWSNAMVMAGLGAVQERIGDFAAENDIPEGTLPHVLAHAVAGGFAAQALGEDFADGALGAASAALTSNLVGESALSEGRQIELQNLIAMSATLLVSEGDAGAVSVVGSIARSLDLNNRQLHTQEIEALKDYAESLDGVDGKTAAEWLSELTLQAMRGVDRQLSTQIEDNPEAQAHLDVLIAQHGETFTNGLGGAMGFLNEDEDSWLFKNRQANLDHVILNREFYDVALADWAPVMLDGLQDYIPASDLLLLDSMRIFPDAPERLVPEELASNMTAEERRVAGNLVMALLRTEAVRIHKDLVNIELAPDDRRNYDTKTGISVSSIRAFAVSEAHNQVVNASTVMRDQLSRGTLIGASNSVISGLAQMMLLSMDQAVLGVDVMTGHAFDIGEATGSNRRNKELVEGFVYLVTNLDELPGDIQQSINSKAMEMDLAIEQGRYVDAGIILGEFQVSALQAATAVGGGSAAMAGTLRKIGRGAGSGSRIDAPGTGVNSAANGALPSGYTRNADGSIRGPRGGIAYETGHVNDAGNVVFRRDSGGYYTIGSDGRQVTAASPYTSGAPPVHHVCTNKSCAGTANGGPLSSPAPPIMASLPLPPINSSSPAPPARISSASPPER